MNPVAGSIRMKLPVVRLFAYRSNTSGRVADTVTVPIWLSESGRLRAAATVRVVCFIAYTCRIGPAFVHPDDLCLESVPDVRRMRDARQLIASTHVDLVVKHQRDRHRRKCLVKVAVLGHDALDPCSASRRPGRDRIADADDSRGYLSRIAAELMIRPYHELDGEPEW